MALETATYISDLVITNPTATDPKSQGDDHLRLTKLVLQNSFPALNGPITPTYLGAVATTALSASTGGALVGSTWFGGAVATVAALATSLGSSLVGFIQSGTGVVARSIQDKVRESVSIKDFGALGDDTFDNYAAFTAAATYILASSKGVNLYIPPGTYRLSASVTFPNSKSFTISGDGDASAIRLTSGSGQAIFNIGSASIYPTRQVVKDLLFQGPASGTSSGIKYQNCNTCRSEYNVFQNQVIGIQYDSCHAAELTGNVFDVCTTYAVYSGTSCHNLIAEKNNFFTCGVGGGGQAINISVASDNIVVNNNDFEYCNVALRLNGGTALSFVGNYAEYCASSIFDFIAPVRGAVIELNWLALGTLSTTIANVQGGSLKNNTIYNQTIGIAASCADFVVGRNYKYGSGTLGQSSWTTPVLSGTFGQQGSYYTGQYIKQENNMVVLRGNLLAGAAGSVIFNLPAGYRPGSPIVFATASSASPGVSIVEVRANGDVWCIARDGAGGTGLNGVVFEAQN